MISVAQVVEKTELSRWQVYAKIRKGEILAWRRLCGRYCVPEDQFSESWDPVPGLSKVVEAIGDPESTWDFLTQNWPMEHTYEWPLECLRRGEVEDVVDSALSYGWAYT